MDGLDDKEAMWVLSKKSLQIREKKGKWLADWPETESYDIGPSSIAWTMWHIIYWWKSALDYNFEQGTLQKEDVIWPENIENAKRIIAELHNQWIEKIEKMSDNEISSTQYAHWPFEGKSFTDIALWLNVELMKNASEIGSGRFLYAARNQ